MLVLPLVCLALTPLVAVAILPPPDRHYNILIILPIAYPSHRNVFLPLATALGKRGHNVTMLNNLPAPNSDANITYIDHGLYPPIQINPFAVRANPYKMIDAFLEDIKSVAPTFYDQPVVRNLYDRRQEFDLIILEHSFGEIAYPFVHKTFFMTVSALGLDTVQSAAMGNLQNPAYVSSLVTDYVHPLTFFGRIINILNSALFPYYYRNMALIPHIHVQNLERFPGLPTISEMAQKTSISLLNDNFIMRPPLPLLPSQVEVGGIHCRPAQPLPKDVEEFLQEGPVIYFSLGTIAKGTLMPIQYQKIIVDTFATLPYKVLWKYEKKRDDISKNVFISKWLPQQDVLAHKNVKLFISHCGLLSATEAMYHGIPILGLPVFADQPRNANKLKYQGVAQILIWEELSVESFRLAIEEMMENPSYQMKASAISAQFKDQPESPAERAVYWTEYVIRHRGAKHLRSPELDLSWVQLLHLDIILIIHILMFVVYKIVKKVFRLCFGTNKYPVKNKRE